MLTLTFSSGKLPMVDAISHASHADCRLRIASGDCPWITASGQNREMESARRMQIAATSFRPPKIAGLDVAVRIRQLTEIGGDFCIYLPSASPKHETIGLVLGDVSGKGIPSALLSTSVAHLLPHLHPLEDAETALSTLNRDLWERSPEDTFVTLVLAEIAPISGAVRLWTAGHTPAQYWCARTGRVHESKRHNLILGAFPEWTGVPEECFLELGDVLLLYSDGLTEARNDRGEWFTPKRVARILEMHAHASADEIADALLAAHSAWGPATDDLSLLVCKRTGLGTVGEQK